MRAQYWFAAALLAAPFAAATATDFDRRPLEAAFPDLEIAAVAPSTVEPWLEVVLGSGQVIYVTRDGEHVLTGSLISLRPVENLTERRRDELRQTLIEAALPADLFEYAAPDARHRVTVVTDIDCPYCRRLHQQMAEYHDQGIGVRYLMLSRAGIDSASYRKAQAAACAADPEAALTRAMNGEALPEANCEHTIAEQHALSQRLQVTGTPAIILESGRLLQGYVGPERLAAEIQRGPRVAGSR